MAKRLEVGANALIWSGGWSAEGARRAISGAKRAGYDYVEIALRDPWSIDVEMTCDLLAEHGLRAHASLGLSAENDVSSLDPAAVARGDALLRRAADVVHAIGATELCGALYCARGRYPGPASPANRAAAVQAMRRLADHCGEHGININLEVVNRYETNLVNTGAEGLALLAEIDRPNAYLHLDSYHMNLEEDGMAAAVRLAGDRLGYVHVGESHRGYLGTGTVDFGSFFAALRQIGYRGPMAFESFSSAVVDPAMASTLCVWRDLWRDPDDIARHARQFIGARLGDTAV